MSLDDWNARYRNREALDDAPAELLISNAASLKPGRALDLACGAGRNAIWLSERGWQVVALDGAEEAIRLIHERSDAIDARIFDLERDESLPFDDESFDLVLILFYLHRPLFAEAKRVLRRGGTIIASALIRGRFGVLPGELATFFSDCEVTLSREEDVAEIVAVKR